MRKNFLAAAVSLSLTGIALASAVVFVDGFDAALKRAADSDKKMVITFTSPT